MDKSSIHNTYSFMVVLPMACQFYGILFLVPAGRVTIGQVFIGRWSNYISLESTYTKIKCKRKSTELTLLRKVHYEDYED